MVHIQYLYIYENSAHLFTRRIPNPIQLQTLAQTLLSVCMELKWDHLSPAFG